MARQRIEVIYTSYHVCLAKEDKSTIHPTIFSSVSLNEIILEDYLLQIEEPCCQSGKIEGQEKKDREVIQEGNDL